MGAVKNDAPEFSHADFDAAFFAARLTADEWGKLCGVSRQAIQGWKQQKGPRPNSHTWRAAGAALNIIKSLIEKGVLPMRDLPEGVRERRIAVIAQSVIG